jgi:glycosyltransferase involved in cell wall biosynthesis
MHILFLSHYFYPEVNAPASRTHDHCKRWVEQGHQVTVVTCAPNCPNGVVYPGYKNSIRKTEIIDGIRVVRVWTFVASNKNFIRRILNFTSYMVSACVNSLFVKKPDVVIATSPQFFCGWAGVLVHWLRRVPFILEIRDIWPESIVTVGAMKKSKGIEFLEYLERKMYESADHIIAVGQGYKDRIKIRKIADEKITVVMNSVDLEKFKPVNDVDQIKKKYHSEGKFVCSYIGTVGMAHGLEVVLTSAKLCKERKMNDLVFWIVGDGARKAGLEKQAKDENLDNVIFTGKLPKEEMPGIIAANDTCLVHLRGKELFNSVIPSKIFELMAMNVPIIMGVRGEAKEIVLNAGAGVEMAPDDPHSLLNCIIEIRTQGKELYKGREFVSKFFNRDVLAGVMLEKITEIAKTRSK